MNPLLLQAMRRNTKNTLSSQTALLEFADAFIVDDRLRSLEKDVRSCLKSASTFPAMLYCFSVIDLLGALYRGNARAGTTTANSRKYMKRSMGYNSEQIRLVQKIFRHKIVHLAQPKHAVEDKNRVIAWRYYHNNKRLHLTLKKFRKPRKLLVRTPYDIYADHDFRISIDTMRKDIERSVHYEQTTRSML